MGRYSAQPLRHREALRGASRAPSCPSRLGLEYSRCRLGCDGFAALRRFVARTGHARVLQDHVEEDGYRLGQWVNVQRLFYGRGKLSRERAERLAALPGWSWMR